MGRKRVCAMLMLAAIVLTLGACGNSQARCDEILLHAYDEIGIGFSSDEEIVPVMKNGK